MSVLSAKYYYICLEGKAVRFSVINYLLKVVWLPMEAQDHAHVYLTLRPMP